MGPRSQYLETVLTCEGDFYAPDFHRQLSVFHERLQRLIAEDERNLILKKVEPWNSVRVTFNIPADAARRLRELAERQDSILRELGILAVQIDGDRVISLTVGGTSSSCDKTSAGTKTAGSDVAQPSNSFATDVPSTSRCETIAPKQSVAEPEPHRTVADVSLENKASSTAPLATSLYVPQVYEGQDLLEGSSISFSQQSSSMSWVTSQANRPDPRAALAMVVAARPKIVETLPFNHGVTNVTSMALTSCTPVDVNAMAAAVQLVQSKLLPGACPNIASSSPLLVNLLQTKRGLCGQPNGPVSTCGTSAQCPSLAQTFESGGSGMMPPPSKRRRNQTRKPKPPPYSEHNFLSASQSATVSVPFPVTAEGIRFQSLCMPSGVQHQLPEVCESMTGVTLPVTESSTMVYEDQQRMLINPYTGALEVVESSDLDEQKVTSTAPAICSVNMSGVTMHLPINTSSSLDVRLLNSANSTGKTFEQNSGPNDSSITTDLSEDTKHVTSVAEICDRISSSASSLQKSSGVYLAAQASSPCRPSMAPLPSGTTAGITTLCHGGKITEQKVLSLSADHSKLDISELVSVYNNQLKNTNLDSCRTEQNIVTPVNSGITVNYRFTDQASIRPGIPLNIGSHVITTTATASLAPINPLRPSLQLVRPVVNSNAFIRYPVTSIPMDIRLGLSATAGVTRATTVTDVSNSLSTGTVSSTNSLSSSNNEQLMRLAFSFVKQNGRTIQVDELTKAGPVSNNSSVAHVSQSILEGSFVNSTTAASSGVVASCQPTSSVIKLTPGLTTSVLGVPSENCFFPAVSCFPPEQRRKTDSRLVGIGGVIESQVCGTSASSMISAMPPVHLSSSAVPASVVSSGWLATTSAFSSELKSPSTSFITEGVRSNASDSVTSNILQMSVSDNKKATTTASGVTSNVLAFGLRGDTFRPLISSLFPVSVVSTAAISGMSNIHVLARAPTVVGVDTKTGGNIEPGITGVYRMPSSGEAFLKSDKIALDPRSIVEITQFVAPATIDLMNKTRVGVAGKTVKQSGSKDRRPGMVKSTEESGLQRGGSKSHLTVAQLLERAKNAKLGQHGANDDKPSVAADTTLDCATITSASGNDAITTPATFTSPNITISASEIAMKVSIDQLRTGRNVYAAGSLHASNVLTQLSTTLHPSQPQTVAASSFTTGMPNTAFAVPQQLPVASPKLDPLNLTESVKKAMRGGVGFYPSPPASPTVTTDRVIAGLNLIKDVPPVSSNVDMAEADAAEQVDEQMVLSGILDLLVSGESDVPLDIPCCVDNKLSESGMLCSNTHKNVTKCSADCSSKEAAIETESEPSDTLSSDVGSGVRSLPDIIVSTSIGNGNNAGVDDDLAEDALSVHNSSVVVQTSSNSVDLDKQSVVGVVVSELMKEAVDNAELETIEVPMLPTSVEMVEESLVTTAVICDTPPISMDTLSGEDVTHDRTPVPSLDSPVKVETNEMASVSDITVTVEETETSEHGASENTNSNVGSNLEEFLAASSESLCPTHAMPVESGVTDAQENASCCNSACTFETSNDSILVNGGVGDAPYSAENVRSVENLESETVPLMTAVTDEPPDRTVTAGLSLSHEACAVKNVRTTRPSTRRTRNSQNCMTVISKSGSSIQVQQLPPPQSAAPAVSSATRMTTRSRNRTLSSSSTPAEPIPAEPVSNSGKLGTRRTPSKSAEARAVQHNVTESSSASVSEVESAAVSNRRSVRVHHGLQNNVDTKKVDVHVTATAADSSTTGVSLRSRVKTWSQPPTPVKSSATKRAASKGISTRQTELAELAMSSEMHGRSNDNFVKCDLNGSEEIS